LDQKKILIIAGELSGDVYGTAIVKNLKRKFPFFKYYGVGGDGMSGEGVNLLGHVRDMAVVGIMEVFRSLGKISKVFWSLDRLLSKDKPDLVILIDYPDFNLLLARRAKKRNIPVVYFISPQVWAWRKGRINVIKRVVDKMLVLFPFEEDMYRRAGVNVSYVGHPLVDKINVFDTSDKVKQQLVIDKKKPVVAIIPGSRHTEIELLLPDMIKSAKLIKKSIPDVQFFIPLADTIETSVVEPFIDGIDVSIVKKSMYEIVSVADFAIVASGTATLEVALLGTPFIICYRVSPLSYIVGKMLIDVPFIGLANIVAEKKVAPELIQGDFTPEAVFEYALSVLKNPEKAASLRKELLEVRKKLGSGSAVNKVSNEIISFLGYNENLLD